MTSTLTSSSSGGCGGAACQCASGSALPTLQDASPPPEMPRINGIALQAPGEALSPQDLHERAYTELLRQEAVRQGRLPAMADSDGALAPQPSEAERQVMEAMLEDTVVTPVPTTQACQRYYEAHKARFVVGQALQVRHILFAVTPGVNVQALAQRAEAALLELLRPDVAPERFATLAQQLSNCPTGANGGDLGWLGPDDCAPELARAFFFQNEKPWTVGVHPRLVHTRFGLHIIEVLAQRLGRQLPFEEVQERIAAQLTLQSRATALRQYMLLLVGQADISGLALEGAASPLVQ